MSDVPGGADCTVRSNAPWVMVTWGHPFPPFPGGQMDTSESIAFPQLRLLAVIKNFLFFLVLKSKRIL